MTPTSPDGEATPADPAAIDLEHEREAMPLIAAVEALRERVDELLYSLSVVYGEKQAIETRVDILWETAEQQAEMRKAAEARVVELEVERDLAVLAALGK